MSNDNKTLADAQPGGRVRLGDQLPPLPYPNYPVSKTGLQNNAYTASQMWDYARAALSAQPSPGGQGDARRQWLEVRGLAAGIVKNLQAFAASPHKAAWCGALDDSLTFADQIEKDAAAAYEAALAARQPVGEPVAWKYRAPGVSFWRVSFRKPVNPEWECEPLCAAPAQAVDLAQIIDHIALQWDGCSYDAVGETIDIGQAIRAAGKRLIDSQAVGNG